MKLNQMLSSTALAAALALSPFIATPVMAQMEGLDMPGTEIMVEDSQIDAFIDAALAVAETRESYMAQLQSATDEAEQMEIVQAADAAILQTVEDAPNITVDEYIAIGEAAAVDPDLAARIEARFAELQNLD